MSERIRVWLFHKRFEQNVDVKNTNQNIKTLDLIIDKNIHILSIYAEHVSKTIWERSHFYKDRPVILTGDFNARIADELITGGIKRKYSDSMRINTAFLDHKCQRKYTCSKIQTTFSDGLCYKIHN